MSRFLWGTLLLVMAVPSQAASVMASVLLDEEEGRALDLDVRIPVTASWRIGAGAGQGESRLGSDEFSGTSLRALTDVQLGGFIATASVERWKDSGQLRSTVLRGELGWMSASGLSLSALVVDRALDVTYSGTLAGQVFERNADFNGTGFGGDVSWFSPTWIAGVRLLDYDYGRNVDRLRSVFESTTTTRFPRLQRLLQSAATRAAGAPDHELSVMLGRQFGRHAITTDWQRQRDALTHEQSWSAGLTWGVEVGRRWMIDTSIGMNDGEAMDRLAWGGVAVTLFTGVSR